MGGDAGQGLGERLGGVELGEPGLGGLLGGFDGGLTPTVELVVGGTADGTFGDERDEGGDAELGAFLDEHVLTWALGQGDGQRERGRGTRAESNFGNDGFDGGTGSGGDAGGGFVALAVEKGDIVPDGQTPGAGGVGGFASVQANAGAGKMLDVEAWDSHCGDYRAIRRGPQ